MNIDKLIQNLRHAESQFMNEIKTLEKCLKCNLDHFYQSTDFIIQKFLEIKNPTFDDKLNFLADLMEHENELDERLGLLDDTFVNVVNEWENENFIRWAIIHSIEDEEVMNVDHHYWEVLLDFTLTREKMKASLKRYIEAVEAVQVN